MAGTSQDVLLPPNLDQPGQPDHLFQPEQHTQLNSSPQNGASAGDPQPVAGDHVQDGDPDRQPHENDKRETNERARKNKHRRHRSIAHPAVVSEKERASHIQVSNDDPDAAPHFVDEKGHDLIYSPEEFEIKTFGFAGKLVQKLGLFAYAMFFFIPLAYVAIFFAIIPLGDPLVDNFSNQWVFLLVSNVCVMLAMAYLYNAAFLAIANCERPFRTSLIPLAFVIVIEIAIMAPALLLHGVFDWIGIASLAALYFSQFAGMFVAYRDLRATVHSFFRRFMTLLILYIPLLAGYVIAYREITSSLGQSMLSFALALVTFVYRRIMLSRLDPFPLDTSQLFAGFWVQNLADCTSILAFPQVRSPSVFAAVFLSNSLSNVAFLGFVSDPWIYKIRPVLKTYVKEAIKCNFPIPPIPVADESFDPTNRGHDNNVGGYRRRQFRFFFFRLLSQAVAMVMYLGISPMLRYGLNKEYTPLGTAFLCGHQYRNSMIYAASNLVFILVVAVFGYSYLHKRHNQTFHEIREIHRHDFVHHTVVGMVTAIITHNLILTIAFILSHYCIFSAFKDCRLTDFLCLAEDND